MSTVVNVLEAKTHLSRLIERAVAGESIVIAKNGVPRVRLDPVEAPARVPLGFVPGIVPAAVLDPLPEDELAAWEALNVEPAP